MQLRSTRVIPAFLIVLGTSAGVAQDLRPAPPFFDYQPVVRTLPPPGPCDESLRPPLIQIGVAVLQDIKELEQRPATNPGEWVEAVRQRYRACISMTMPLQERTVGRVTAPSSPDEVEVRRGMVQRRLIRLALTGRVTKAEFDSLARRLQGNY